EGRITARHTRYRTFIELVIVTTRELPSQYTPAQVENRNYERWVAEGYFRADPSSGREPYTIVLPPPNVTGSLHIGHALDHSIHDALTLPWGASRTRPCYPRRTRRGHCTSNLP